MSSKDDFLVSVDAQLFLLQSKVNLIKATAKDSELESKPEFNRFLDELTTKQDIAREKVRQLEKAGDDSLGDLKKGANQALQELDSAITEVTSRFRN